MTYQIFVVEDELLIRQRIREMVEGMGAPYTFCGEAADGEMALSMMQDLMPDILLTDIRMPFLDGFGLIEHAKSSMPWLKIIIISGYDEFESAQKAISLGVDAYLLKPIQLQDLTQAIDKVAQQLQQSRRKLDLAEGYNKDEMQYMLYQHFMKQLLFGEVGTSQLLERAQALQIEMVHPFYQVVLFHFEQETGQPKNLQPLILKAMKGRRTAIYYVNSPQQLTLVAYAKTKEELSENVYRIINILSHALKEDGVLMTTLVGNIVQRLSAIKQAYAASDALLKQVQTVCVGSIIDSNDTAQVTTEISTFASSFNEKIGSKLLRASLDEVPGLLKEYWASIDNDPLNSLLYRYYTLVDILKAAIQLVVTANPELDRKDIAVQFSGTYDIFIASRQRDTFEAMALEILQAGVQMRQAHGGGIKQSHVISRAEEYIAQNYCDPNISLLSVAKHIGMSSAHFSTVFSQTVGKTFISYLTGLRIEKAKTMLASTDIKLSAIAMEIGYNEPNYFSHVFKKSEGVTPKEYRSGKR